MENEIELNKSSLMGIQGVKLTTKGAVFDKDLSFENWEKIGRTLKHIEKSILFWLGDWINFGERNYGEKYAQALDATGYEYGTLRNAASVSANVDLSRRRDNVSFSHHTEVAHLTPKEQTEWLDLASENEDIGHKELRSKIRISKNKELLDSVKTNGHEERFTLTSSQQIIPCNAVITDPPYGILDEQWEPEDLMGFTKDWLIKWNECKAESFVIFWSQGYLFQGKEWFDKWLLDYEFQQLLVWNYPNNVKPQSRMGFKQTWEPIFYYRRKGSSKKVGIMEGEWAEGLNCLDCHTSAVPQSNFNDDNTKVHPAQKPVSVFRWLINALTIPGDIVCDPFCGSGTSGIAAMQLCRKYHGIEIDKEYIKLANARIIKYGQ